MKKMTKLEQSIENCLMEEAEQYPARPPAVPSPGEVATEYPVGVETEWDVVVCSRLRNPGLSDAAHYFAQLKRKRPWQQESAIYRTAKFWCIRVWPKIGIKE